MKRELKRNLKKTEEVKTYIACYKNRPLMMKSLAKVLTGELKAQGKLPVTI
jgi:beta-N-acetylhexosaminidase